MTVTVLFRETQTFRQTWVWYLLLPLNILFIYGLVQQLVLGQPFGDMPASNLGLLIGFLLVAGISFFIYSIRLETTISDQGLSYRFFPIERKMTTITWQEIQKAYIREYRPIVEYGGWGIRVGMFGKGKAYNVSGNVGLQVELQNGKKILFGTQESNEIESLIRRYLPQE
jgi:hypothetical protein